MCMFLQHEKFGTIIDLQITLKGARCKFNTERQYFSFPAELRTSSVSLCSQNTKCGWGRGCSFGHHVSHSSFTQQSLEYSGVSRCYPVSMSSNCIITDSMHCLYTRVYLYPDYENSYEIRKLTSLECEYTLEVKESTKNYTETLHVKGSARTRSGITMRILGALDSPVTLFNGENLIVNVADPTLAFLESASKQGRPVAGEIGSIQATEPYSKKFLFPQNLWECMTYEEQISCQKQESFLNTLIQQKHRALPKVLGYHYLQLDAKGQLFSEVLSSPAIVLSLHFQGYSIKMMKAEVCAQFSDKQAKVSGCFSCESFSQIILRAYSTCEEGAVQVTATNLAVVTPSVFLSKTEEDITIKFRSEIQCVQTKVCLTSDELSRCRDLDFCLNKPDLKLSFPNLTHTSNGHHVTGNTQFQWPSILGLNSFFSFSKIFVGAGIVLLVFLLYGAVASFFRR